MLTRNDKCCCKRCYGDVNLFHIYQSMLGDILYYVQHTSMHYYQASFKEVILCFIWLSEFLLGLWQRVYQILISWQIQIKRCMNNISVYFKNHKLCQEKSYACKKKKKVKYLLHNWYVFYSSKLGILAIKNHPFWDVLKQNMYLIVKHTFICDLSLCHMMCCKQFLEYNIMHVLFYFRIYWEQCPVTPVFATYKVQVSQDYDEFFVG